MGKTYDGIDDRLRAFIEAQHMFFVATAPLSGDGLVNVSPKGLDAFRVLGPREVGYLDLVGSGIETIAHVRENGRLTIMFCAFEGPPKIVRLHGTGHVHEPGTSGYEELAPRFISHDAARAIITLDVARIADSCGFGVPRYAFDGDRDQITRYAASKSPEAVAEYKATHNRTSLDGLPGLALDPRGSSDPA